MQKRAIVFFFLVALGGEALIPTAGQTGNNLATANYFNTLVDYAPLATTIANLSSLTPSQLTEAMESLAPTRNTHIVFASMNAAFDALDVSMEHLAMNHFRRAILPFPAQERPNHCDQPVQKKCFDCDFWVDGFYDIIRQGPQHQTPSFKANVGSGSLGFDFFYPRSLWGFDAGIARTSLREGRNAGFSTSNLYYATGYGSLYFLGHGAFDWAFLAGVEQFQNTRHLQYAGLSDESTSSQHIGGVLLPHLGLGYAFQPGNGHFILEPFGAIDAALFLEREYSEHGMNPLNMRMEGHVSCLLRSQAGCNFYESWTVKEETFFLLRESLFYVNKAPFHVGGLDAKISKAPGSAYAVTSLTAVQSLFGIGAEFLLSMKNGALLSLSYRGEISGPYRSNEVQIQFGRYF